VKSWEVEEEKGVDDCWQRSWPEGAKQMPFKYLHFSNSIKKEVEGERRRRRRRKALCRRGINPNKEVPGNSQGPIGMSGI